jgi:hypothetical protein
MPRQRSGGSPPSGEEVDDRWRQFCNRLDDLDAHVTELRQMTADLLELGHGISLALRDLAAAGVPGGTLVRVLNRLVTEFVAAAARRKEGT